MDSNENIYHLIFQPFSAPAQATQATAASYNRSLSLGVSYFTVN